MHHSVCMVLILLVVSFAVNTRAHSVKIRTVERPYVGSISVSNGRSWGTWEHREMCPIGTYAIGFSLKVQRYQGNGDETALNGIALRCGSPRTASSLITSYSTVRSDTGSWGKWTDNIWCANGVMRYFKLRVEPALSSGDNTAANNIIFMCTGGQTLEGNGLSWGTWGDWSEGCPGTGICGIETNVEPPQGGGDDTALNDVRFFCCN